MGLSLPLPTAPLVLWDALCPAPTALTLAGIAVSVEQVAGGAEAAVGAGEVEAVVEAKPGLGTGLEELALIHILGGQSRAWLGLPLMLSLSFQPLPAILMSLLPWHMPLACIWKPASQLQRREPGRPSAQRGWRLKEALLSVTQSAGVSGCHCWGGGHGEMGGG